VVVPLLAFAGWRVHRTVVETAAFQERVRLAQVERGHAVRAQLDEETGLRGYTITGDPEFLEPYVRGHASLAKSLDTLQATLAPLAIPGARALVADEARTSATWNATVAPYLIARNGSAAQTKLLLEKRGKFLIDRFRADDAQVQTLLAQVALDADQRSDLAISRTLVYNIGLLVVLSLAAIVFGSLQARAARSAFESRLLYQNEKRVATSLQRAFLQKTLPATPGLRVHAIYLPASKEAQVGGDWYDAFELPDKSILFSIGDVAGHGLEAAIAMSHARQAIVAAALSDSDPASVLSTANRSILLQDGTMVTAVCGFLDPVTREIVYATAGHPPPILVQNGVAAFLEHEGVPLGIVAGNEYRTFTAHALAGALLVLYTDGVTEGHHDVLAGEARLLEAARLAAGEDDPAAAIERRVFADAAPTDDVAILTLAFAPAPAASAAGAAAGDARRRRRPAEV
jgi:serine phosphatase RsbU (regulator of sigma subunit)